MKEINCPKCNQHIKILGTDYDLYKENLLKEEQEIERLKQGYCELKEKCNKGECDCTHEEYNGMCEENIKMDLEIQRLKEEYVMLQNASDEVEEEKDKEIERLNSIIKEVREYIKENMSYIEKGKLEYIPSGEDILEILDKEK